MALKLHLKHFQVARIKGDKVAKVSFRGVTHFTRVSEDGGEFIEFGEHFEWPVARPVEQHEALEIRLLVPSRYRSSRVVGTYGLILQKVVQDGRLAITDTLVDQRNKPISGTVTFEVTYSAPDGSVGSWSSPSTAEALDEDQQLLLDIEQNIASLESSLTHAQQLGRRASLQDEITSKDNKSNKQDQWQKKRSSTLRSLVRLGKQRPGRREEEEQKLLYDESDGGEDGGPASRPPSVASMCSNSGNESTDSVGPREQSRTVKRLRTLSHTPPPALKAQDFQLCVTVIEARQLAGLNMDPVVCVQVGDQKKYTSVKESTNCPYYNEYFVFDFHMPPVMLFDKIVTLTVLHSRTFIRQGAVVGRFKIGLKTVYDAPEHQFYHKWALLTDPDDVAGGPKGYLKVDISVIGKGSNVKVPPKSEKDEDDIEANLLVPDGMSTARQRARFIVRIYRADGLPKMNSDLVANVRKAFTGETKDLVDPYVRVSFAGLTGKTSVKKNSYAPVWNEQVVFTEMFPPLCQRIKVQLRDNDPVNDSVIGTHFIDLNTISNDGDKGFLPTFGPAFVHLYGSTRDYSLLKEHAPLNDGLGEGVSYRARLLIAIRTEVSEAMDLAPSEVEVESTLPIAEGSYGKNEEFFLYASILETTMIERKLSDRPIYFEISIGNAGNGLDGQNCSQRDSEEGDGSSNLELIGINACSWQSTTPPAKPLSHDRLYYFLPFWEDKPCMYIRSVWPDQRRRMYNSNVIAKIVEKLEDGLAEVGERLEAEDNTAEKVLAETLETLCQSCNRYTSLYRGQMSSTGSTASNSGRTRLDKERAKLCQREIEHISNMSRYNRTLLTSNNVSEKYKIAQGFLKKLKFLIEDPQHSLPDLFIWLIYGGKRVAYHRIPARELMYSIVDEESGKHCGKVQTMLLKLPGKKSLGQSGWTIQARLRCYMWLGLVKHKKNYHRGLPQGYANILEIQNSERPTAAPPSTLHYTEKCVFQMRGHMYQARSLIGSDSSGLSDPFARVIIGEQCKSTQVIDETLSPTWDELLVIDDVTIFSRRDEVKEDPPNIIIEIFDRDKVGKSEFLGRAIARPHVKLSHEPYKKPQFPPSLEWYDIFRGGEQAGELLATFELLELPQGVAAGQSSESLPPLPVIRSREAVSSGEDVGPIFPVPPDIRPTLAKYRIEVLFWGLRELKRVNFMSVDQPRVDIECCGNILQSSVILNARKNPNFSTPVKFLDLELPEQELYCPPLTIRVVDCRSFGRYTLVGTHTIASLHRFLYTPLTRRDREMAERKKSLNLLQVQDTNADGWHATERNAQELYVSMGHTPEPISKREKTEANKKRKQSIEDVDDDEESWDWWSKYFASVEAMIEASREARHKEGQPNGSVSFTMGDSIADSSTKGHHSSSRDQVGGGVAGGRDGGGEHEIVSLASHEQESKLKGLTFKKTSAAVKIAARLSPSKVAKKSAIGKVALLKIFPHELEAEPGYDGFREWLQTFDLYRGKKTGDELEDDARVVGKFKGAIKVYKWPLPKDIDDYTIMGFDPQYGFFQGLPSNDPIHVLVRVYIVKAHDLHPMDMNGKADPYIVLQLGSKRISDKENYISKQLNPVFGKCFEFEATFPQDSLLTIQIFDWDLVGTDDLIGETRIDLENRFYSRHRATCGIAWKYEVAGYNQWRDPMKPTQILARLCKEGKVDAPQYSRGKVKVGNRTFSLMPGEEFGPNGGKNLEEHLALMVLQHWHEIPRVGCHLVPEHVETRMLYNSDKPGIEQGKLEMWVDLFPMDMPLPAFQVDISPRKPKSYELRVIIWNTEDVVLEDDAFFTGEKMSDIYVKGWLKGPEDCQCTDIHYRSLTGEGNFNWRFVYPFDYLVAEEKIVISRKESLFSWDETECKIPARLELQVWDADHFSADDFLGALTLDLNRFPRGAKSGKLCTLNMLHPDVNVPMINIFKQRRVKGWWPFYVKKDNEELELTGKVEAEIHLLTREEAEKNPAGLGRSEPEPLDKPNRPDSSFMWFLNPLKSLRYILWHNYKWLVLKVVLVMALALLLLLFFYSLPGYTAKKIVGA